MHRISPAEVHALHELLRAQAMAIEKYGAYAAATEDAQIRMVLQEAQSRHLRRYHVLWRHLQEQAGHARAAAAASQVVWPTGGTWGARWSGGTLPAYGAQLAGGGYGNTRAASGPPPSRPREARLVPEPVRASEARMPPAGLTGRSDVEVGTIAGEAADAPGGLSNVTYGEISGGHEQVLLAEPAQAQQGAGERRRRPRGAAAPPSV